MKTVKTLFFSWPVVAYIIDFSLISTVLAYLCYTIALFHIETGRAAIVATLEPIVATLVGTMFFGEGDRQSCIEPPADAGGFFGVRMIFCFGIFCTKNQQGSGCQQQYCLLVKFPLEFVVDSYYCHSHISLRT